MGWILSILAAIGPKILRAFIDFLRKGVAHCYADNKDKMLALARSANELYPAKSGETLQDRIRRIEDRTHFFADGAKDIIVTWCKDHGVEFSESMLNTIRELAVQTIAGKDM